VVTDGEVDLSPALATGARTLQPAAAAAALSSGNGHAGTTYADNGYASDGPEGNGYAGNGHADNGYADNGNLGMEPAGNGHLGTEPAGTAHLSTEPAGTAHLSTEPAGTAHLSTEPAGTAHLSTEPAGTAHAATAEPRRPRHAASPHSAVRPEDTQPFQASPPRGSADSGWWARSTQASRQAADSIQAGQAVAGVTELVPGPEAGPGAGQPDGELPVRVRQAALAPQLRDRDAAGSEELQAPASAEAVRSTMSAMQSGWERARSVAGTPPAGADPDAAASAEQNAAGQDPAGQDPAGQDPAGQDPAGHDPADQGGE